MKNENFENGRGLVLKVLLIVAGICVLGVMIYFAVSHFGATDEEMRTIGTIILVIAALITLGCTLGYYLYKYFK